MVLANFRRKLGRWKWNNYDIMKQIAWIRKTQKLFETKGSKMVRWWTTKEKIFWTNLVILRAVPETFWDGVQKLKTNWYFQKIFDIALAQYLISWEFLECNGYIPNYLPSQSKHSRLVLQKNYFKKTLWSLCMDGVQACLVIHGE